MGCTAWKLKSKLNVESANFNCQRLNLIMKGLLRTLHYEDEGAFRNLSEPQITEQIALQMHPVSIGFDRLCEG